MTAMKLARVIGVCVRGVSVPVAGVCLAPAIAHHSTAINFEAGVAPLEGRIQSVKLVNPHCSFILEVTNEDGSTEEWLIEMLARIALERQGFDLDALQPGLFVRLKGRPGYRANTIYFEEAELPDGRILMSPGPIR